MDVKLADRRVPEPGRAGWYTWFPCLNGTSSARSSVDRASVFGTEGREFESLRARPRAAPSNRASDPVPAVPQPSDFQRVDEQNACCD